MVKNNLPVHTPLPEREGANAEVIFNEILSRFFTITTKFYPQISRKGVT